MGRNVDSGASSTDVEGESADSALTCRRKGLSH